jgi:predicted ribosomally synthesized peptide with nif11-like leader
MPIQDAKDFINRMDQDMDFRQRILHEDSVAQRGRLIREGGFDFTREEYEQVTNEMDHGQFIHQAGSDPTQAEKSEIKKEWLNQIFSTPEE